MKHGDFRYLYRCRNFRKVTVEWNLLASTIVRSNHLSGWSLQQLTSVAKQKNGTDIADNNGFTAQTSSYYYHRSFVRLRGLLRFRRYGCCQWDSTKTLGENRPKLYTGWSWVVGPFCHGHFCSREQKPDKKNTPFEGDKFSNCEEGSPPHKT